MTDDQSPPRSPFSWGLRPSGEPEEPEGSGPAADATPPAVEDAGVVDRGEFLALPLKSGATGDDWEGEATAAFDFQAPPPPASTLPTAVYHEGPTLPWEHPAAFDPALAGAAALGAQEAGIDHPVDESAPTNAIDALFGDENFQEYDDAPAQPLVKSLVPVSPSKELLPVAPPKPPKAPKQPTGPRGPLPRSQRIGIWVAGGLVAALGLTGLYFVGTRIPDAPQQAAPVASAPPTPAATEDAPAPVEPVAAIGPVAPGVHEWDELLGTECVEPFTTAWEQEYTVVDCGTPHSAQLVYRGRFEDPATDAYPGVESLQSRMNLLCTSPENIDYAVASQVDDIQFSASFAGTEDDWADGNRNYFCFVNRASGEPLAMSIATAPRAPVAIPVAPAPEP